MDAGLYLLAKALVALVQALPLQTVARLGRRLGGLAFWLDARHRRVALQNLALCFGAEKSSAEIRALAREHFRRLGENYLCAIKTAAMPLEALRPSVTFVGQEKIRREVAGGDLQSLVVAIGHFGNFELYARFGQLMSGFQGITTYRSLRQPSLNRLMQSLRERSGCRFFERRTEAAALKAALRETGVILGFLADQHAGDKGRRLPFFGHACSTSAAPALFALRYRFPLWTAVCFRTDLGRWQIEVGDEIPTRENGRPRAVDAIALDINRAFEAAIRRDPANWFWVHKRWKPAPPNRQS
ncbi:MAG: hypothetical protein HY674_05970 [Chloroflexi bacterium]|nr:hypothetical protein [Chloroflexota bacterium]